MGNGAELVCDKEIVDCVWTVDEHEFKTTMKILPLGIYDEILGIDWSVAHSPMKVDWADKVMVLKEHGQKITICGMPDTQIMANETLTQQLHVFPMPMSSTCLNAIATDREEQPNLPADILAIVQEFPGVFAEPSGLPPRRACDHQIPLIAGAQPVSIRPYRHSQIGRAHV